MKKSTIYMTAAAFAVLVSSQSCTEKYVTYDAEEYVMFADTAATCVVREDIPFYDVPVVSTTVCPYDRTFAVEVLDGKSNATEGYHYTIEDNNFTIPAGERAAHVRIKGISGNLDEDDELYFTLKLIIPDRLRMDLYGDETLVRIRKTKKFVREDFCGWAVVSSMFLYQFSLTGSFQRLIYTSADPDNENGVILHNFLVDGYDVSISFDDDTDPLHPTVDMKGGQVVSDEAQIFGMVHGDNHILIEKSNLGVSYFFAHARVAVLVNRFYVENIGETVGTVDHFLTEIDWVSDEEAERLKREDGM